ncbi:MAG: MGH1-like glycoside hydrolase domain-containing protein [Ruthenibacterium lactatiformans]
MPARAAGRPKACGKKLASEEHLWSACGLHSGPVRPYYRRDGYWNGAVWMPYQWMFFKAALDAGKTGFAFRIADTALWLWQDECAASTIASSIL